VKLPDSFPWPKPTQEAALKRWEKGQVFVLSGGPHDGMLLRLWPHPYPEDTTVSGWDEIKFRDGSVYRRPADVDPYMERKGKPNKKRTNVPFMAFDEEASSGNVRVPVAA
jgi:hypothetical protein